MAKRVFQNTDSLDRVWPNLVNPKTSATLELQPGETAELDPETQILVATEAQIRVESGIDEKTAVDPMAVKAKLGVAEDDPFVFSDPFLKPVSNEKASGKASGKASAKPADSSPA